MHLHWAMAGAVLLHAGAIALLIGGFTGRLRLTDPPKDEVITLVVVPPPPAETPPPASQPPQDSIEAEAASDERQQKQWASPTLGR